MRHSKPLLVMAPAMLAAACARLGPVEIPVLWSAPLPLVNASGAVVGSVQVSAAGGNTLIRVAASGLQPGLHGIHIHAVGKCEAPKFDSAGPHWNPAIKRHGLENAQGPHGGDLPNVTVSADGRLATTLTAQGSPLAAMLDADGAALAIHAGPDDYRTDPSGNSGARIACAVLGR